MDSPSGMKRVDGMGLDSTQAKRLKRTLTHEADIKVYDKNIHETMKSLPALRDRRKSDYDRVMTLFNHDSHARDRRTQVFEFFNKAVTREVSYQTSEVYDVSQDLLSVLDESREHLELLINWCDLLLPANEQAFAEAHRIKIQDFQDYLSSGLNTVAQSIQDVNAQLEKRAQTLRMLFTTKDVLPENYEGWSRTNRDLLVHTETNAYLHVAKTWEKVLEDYLLYYNYWKVNLKDSGMVFANANKGGSGDYFG